MVANPPTPSDGGDTPEPDDEVPFEDLVAALLRVDPEGIVGQRKAEARPGKPSKPVQESEE